MQTEIDNYAIEDFLLNETITNSLIVIKGKLDLYKISISKIMKNDADFIYAAYQNVSEDLLNGGMQYRLFNYLNDFETIPS